MQIRAVTVNAAGMAAERNIQGNAQQAQPVGSMFSAQCRVTISQEGRRRSRQQTDQTEKSVQSARAEQKLFRRKEEAEQNKHSAEGYREQLEKIEQTIDSCNRSYKTDADKETIEKEQEVLRAMRDQKQAQMEENQKRAKEAQQMAVQSAKYQEEIDENNRNLLTLLKSLEEAEKTEEEQECGEGTADSGSGASGADPSVSNVIQNSAAQFTASSVKRALGVDEMLAGLSDGGHQLLDMADSITRNVIRESEGIRAALDDDAFTDDARAELMERFQERAGLNEMDVERFREHGLHILQAAREYRIKHIADDPLRGMQETKKSMMLSAVDAAVGEAVQGSLGKASQELKEQVEKLVDERNDVDRIRRDDEDDKKDKDEEAEALEELLQPEEK